MFINTSAAKRILSKKYTTDKNIIVVKLWKLNANCVCVRFRLAGSKFISNTIIKKDLFLLDAIAIRKSRVISSKWECEFNQSATKALVTFEGKDHHVVEVSLNNIACDCPDYIAQAEGFQNDFKVPPICSHLLVFSTALGFNSFGEYVKYMRADQRFAA